MTANIVTPYITQKDLIDAAVTIKITKAHFAGVIYKEGKIVLSFENCRFNKLTIINEEEIEFKDISIAFFSCIIDDLKVENITAKNISIGFYGSVISGVIRNENITGVELNNCLLKNSIFIIGVQSAIVKFTKENIQLYRWKKLFRHHRINSYADLLEKQFYYISESKKVGVSSNYKSTLKNNRFKVNLSISYYGEGTDIETTIADIQLASVSLSGNSKGRISVENTKIGSWYIYDFIPTGQVSFYNIEPSAVAEKDIKIGIHRCNLDNVSFDNVSFDKYSIISFYRTKFSKATFTSCNFPDNYAQFSRFTPIENVHYPQQVPPNYDKDQYEIFLQLKKALEDTGNAYEALKLHSVSHEALLKIKTITPWDRFILRVNSLSNNHGLSIKRPFVGLLVFSIVFYILYLWSLDRIFTQASFDPQLIGYYFSFLDITHRSDFLVKPEAFTGWSLALDYVNKVIVGFFIFQFIAAFRKYGKK